MHAKGRRVRNLKWVSTVPEWVKRGRWARCVSFLFLCFYFGTTIGMCWAKSKPTNGTNEWAESESFEIWFMTITEKWWRVVPSAQSHVSTLKNSHFFRNNKVYASLSTAQCDFCVFFSLLPFFHVGFYFILHFLFSNFFWRIFTTFCYVPTNLTPANRKYGATWRKKIWKCVTTDATEGVFQRQYRINDSIAS